MSTEVRDVLDWVSNRQFIQIQKPCGPVVQQDLVVIEVAVD